MRFARARFGLNRASMSALIGTVNSHLIQGHDSTMASTDIQSLMEQSPYKFNENVEYRILLYEIIQELQNATRFFDVYLNIEKKLCALLKCERVVVYKRGRHKRELSGYLRANDKLQEVRLDFSPNSLAGYVAMTQKPLCIQDVTDEAGLRAIHPLLRNDAQADKLAGTRTRATMAVPVFYGKILIGVLQLVNRIDGEFSPAEFQKLNVLATMLGEHFYGELGVTDGPFDLLTKRGIISHEQLQDMANADSGRSIAQRLVTDLHISREMVGESLQSFYQVPFAPFDLNTKVPAKLLENINPKYVRHQGWVPIAENGREVTILIDNPADADRIMVIEQLFRGRKIKLLLMFPEEIADIAEAALSGDDVSAHSLEQLTDLAAEEVIDIVSDQRDDAREHDSGVVRLLNRLITDAYSRGASDIHIQSAANSRPANVLFRIDGVCRSISHIPNKLIKPVISRLKVMSSLDLAEHRLPQDGKCSVKCRGQTIELRVAIIPNSYGLETAVIRLLSNCEAMHIYGLNLSETNLGALKQLAEAPHGLLLVVGPTGSGKTTSLHSVLGHINNGERIIWTVEDPVEITQPGLQQVNVNRRTGLTFAAALRAFMRADPDVILVGEMRDKETADIAVQASMTGHLVLSTLHTNTAVDTINRLMSMGLEAFDIADALIGILSQRLARTLCTHCMTEQVLDDEAWNYLENIVATHDLEPLPPQQSLGLKTGGGCEACSSTGYHGRVGIHELLAVSGSIRELIAGRAPAHKIVEQSRAEGMPCFAKDALDKLMSGMIDYREFRKITAFSP